jgi:hypothetical protein
MDETVAISGHRCAPTFKTSSKAGAQVTSALLVSVPLVTGR